MNGVLGDFGLQVVGDVFDEAGARAAGPRQRPAAVGAGRQLVSLVVVDHGRVAGGRRRGDRSGARASLRRGGAGGLA